jgi:hypothetical protein
MMIALGGDGSYQMLDMATDCSSRIFNDGGTRYKRDGQMLGPVNADQQPSPLTSSDLSRAALEACRAARENQSFGGAFDAQKALTALFGNYDVGSKTSSVTVARECSYSGRALGTLSVMLDSLFSQAGTAKHLLVTSTTVEGEDGHACGARIGAFVFTNRAGRWIPEIVDKEALRFGESGKAYGEARLVRFAPDVYGFSLIGDKGDYEEFVAPVANHYRSVLSVDLDLGNANHAPCGFPGYPACVNSQLTVRLLGSAHGLFDVETSEIGTELNDQGGVVPVKRKRLYIFSGDKYVEQAAAH